MTSNAPKPFVFILMPFHKQFDELYTGIKGVIDGAGALCDRADQQSFSEPIPQHVYNEIARADIVVAEMSDHNPNVFYEVGYSHALGKTTILLARADALIPFDLKYYPHVIYDHIETLKRELKKRVAEHLKVPTKHFQAALFTRFYQERLRDISPPNLLFLAAAEYFTWPSTHGAQVARLNPDWQCDEVEWDNRSKIMEKMGLLDRNKSEEIMRTYLGTAIVFLALRDPAFIEVIRTMQSDQGMTKKWGISDA